MNDQLSPTNRAKAALLARESINSLLDVRLCDKTIEVYVDDIENYLQSLAKQQLLKETIVAKNREIEAHIARCITLKLDKADWWTGESIDSAIASVKAICPSKIKPAY